MVPNTFSLLASSCFQVFVLVKIMGYYFTAICQHAFATILENLLYNSMEYQEA